MMPKARETMKPPSDHDERGGRLPLTETARRLGSHRVTNVVSLGAIAGLRPICSDEALEAAVARYAPPKFRDLNLSALAEGRALTSVASHTA